MADETDRAFAERLADAAGAAIRPWFRTAVDVERKGDASPVTRADRDAEAAMRALIEAAYPDDGIVGEEFGRREGSSGRVWVLDPIDGTRAFIAGRPIFGTLIGLAVDDVPVLGVLDQPVLGERWVGGAGEPTRFNGRIAATRRCRALDLALLATTSPALFDDAGRAAFARVDGAAYSTVLGGDCYNYGGVAAGHLDLVVEAGLKFHDFAALVPIVEGAGGRMCDWGGDPLTATSKGDVVAIGDPARLNEVLALLHGSPPHAISAPGSRS